MEHISVRAPYNSGVWVPKMNFISGSHISIICDVSTIMCHVALILIKKQHFSHVRAG